MTCMAHVPCPSPIPAPLLSCTHRPPIGCYERQEPASMRSLAGKTRAGLLPVCRGRQSCSSRTVIRSGVPVSACNHGRTARARPCYAVSDSCEQDLPLPVTSDNQASWQRLQLLRRQLEIAVAEERYDLAAKLRDELKVLLDSMPLVHQYLHRQVHKLCTGTPSEKQQAIKAIVDTADPLAIPQVAACLRDPELQDAAFEAMWQLFMKHPDPEINQMMVEGVTLMTNPAGQDKALSVFTQMISRVPDFAEAYNKRATMLYILKRFEESIDDCKEVLRLQPYHFGAYSGMGLCYLMLSREAEAVAAFEQALAIHPGLHEIGRVLGQLKKRIAQAAAAGAAGAAGPSPDSPGSQ